MDPNLAGSFFRLLLALPLVIGLAYLSLRIGKKYMHAMGQGKTVKVIEAAPLTGKAYVSIVKVGREYMALGVAEGSVRVLKTLSAEEVEELLQRQEEAMDIQKQFTTVKDWIGSLKDGRFHKDKSARRRDRKDL